MQSDGDTPGFQRDVGIDKENRKRDREIQNVEGGRHTYIEGKK